MVEAPSLPTSDDLLPLALKQLRTPSSFRQYGDQYCDFHTTNLASAWAKQEGAPTDIDFGAREHQILPVAMDVAWIFVRRGILRPGGKSFPDTNSDPGRFSLTGPGRKWLAVADASHFVVMQTGALAETLAAFRKQFGDGFAQRADEALRCREAGAWLATCAMCGAAAESILLKLAVAKDGSEEAVLAEYRRASGRKKTIDTLVGKQPDSLQRPFRSLVGILSYWRDDAAHGEASPISAPEAEEALRQLLLLVQFAERHWKALTT